MKRVYPATAQEQSSSTTVSQDRAGRARRLSSTATSMKAWSACHCAGLQRRAGADRGGGRIVAELIEAMAHRRPEPSVAFVNRRVGDLARVHLRPLDACRRGRSARTRRRPDR